LSVDAQPNASSSSRSSLRCPPAPFLPSCHNFHSPSPVRGSIARFSFLDDLSAEYDNDEDLDDDLVSEGTMTPVQYPRANGFEGGNLLGLFVDDCERDEDEERNKGVLRAALERMELDPRYMDVFNDSEDEDEGELSWPFNNFAHHRWNPNHPPIFVDYLTFNLDSPFSQPPPLVRRDSSSSSDEYSSSANSTGDYSPPPPLSFGRFGSTGKILLLDDDVVQESSRSGEFSRIERDTDDVEILDLDYKAEREEAVEEGPYRYRRFREDEDVEGESFSSSLDPALAHALGMGGWRIPAYLRRGSDSGLGSGCTSTVASTPSFKSLTPVSWENSSSISPLPVGDRWQAQNDQEDALMLDAFSSSSSRSNISTATWKMDVPSAACHSGHTRRRSDDGVPEKRRKLEHRSARVIDGSLFT